jgi:hypothetical protein
MNTFLIFLQIFDIISYRLGVTQLNAPKATYKKVKNYLNKSLGDMALKLNRCPPK